MIINEEFREATLKKFANNENQIMNVVERIVLDQEAIPQSLLEKIRIGDDLDKNEIAFIVKHIRGLSWEDFCEFKYKYLEILNEEQQNIVTDWDYTFNLISDEDIEYFLKYGTKSIMQHVKWDVEDLLPYDVLKECQNNKEELFREFCCYYTGYPFDLMLEFLQVNASWNLELAKVWICKAADEVLAERAAKQ